MSLFSDLEELPDDPGVYLIKDKGDKVIYVGKAKSLKKRVKQHFQAVSLAREEKLQELASRVDWILTRNESEAIILEEKLVKQLSPKLNSMLKDDKSNLLISITLVEKYPQLLIVRETDSRNEKNIYFGPFPSNIMLRQTVKLVLRLFPICNCGKNVENLRIKKSSIRCMRERLDRCLAPCKNDISPEEYKKTVKNVISFLNGDVADLLDNLEKEMWSASEEADFERATIIRDLIQSVRTILNLQEDLHSKIKNTDVLAFIEEEPNLAFCKLEIRNHRVQNIKNYITSISEKILFKTLSEVLAFIYGTTESIKSILISDDFTKRFNPNINLKIIYPKDNTSNQLVDIAKKNARTELFKFLRDIQYGKDSSLVLKEMKDFFQLPEEPTIIHGFDISTLKGQLSVGSCVTFVDGHPKKNLYRRFRIRGSYTDPDDYAMMEEVIKRKYSSEVLKSDPLPNLLIIDGGKGQLNIALDVLKKLNLSIPAVSIAKKNEEIYVEWSDLPITLDQDSFVLKLVQNVRDEAHRFAISYHKTLRARTVKSSNFERIKGIGKTKVFLLFQEYKNTKNIASASIEEIKKLISVNEKIAKKVIETAKRSSK
jgi:excinuclease ABC subunit C